MTSHCFMSTLCALHWDAVIELDQYTKDEIVFWKDSIPFVKSRYCFLDKKPHVFGYSDTSATGCGSVITLDSEQMYHKVWNLNKSSKIST